MLEPGNLPKTSTSGFKNQNQEQKQNINNKTGPAKPIADWKPELVTVRV